MHAVLFGNVGRQEHFVGTLPVPVAAKRTVHASVRSKTLSSRPLGPPHSHQRAATQPWPRPPHTAPDPACPSLRTPRHAGAAAALQRHLQRHRQALCDADRAQRQPRVCGQGGAVPGCHRTVQRQVCAHVR